MWGDIRVSQALSLIIVIVCAVLMAKGIKDAWRVEHARVMSDDFDLPGGDDDADDDEEAPETKDGEETSETNDDENGANEDGEDN